MELSDGLLLFAVATFAVLLIAGRLYFPKIYRLLKTINLFKPGVIVKNFRNLHHIFPSTTVKRADQPYHFDRDHKKLPAQFEYKGAIFNTRQFIKDTGTTGFLVIQDDRIRWEEYRLGYTDSTTAISWSMAKSVISGLFGIALAEGHINSIGDRVTDYVPELIGSGYEGVRIKDVLQMSSGVAFNEDYGDFHSDISRFGRTLALGGSLDKFTASLKREKEPGTYHHYVSIDTQVLGMILVRVTGFSLTDYLQKKIWQKMGSESDAYWITDNDGMELALGGLNSTLRDFARLGRLYLHNGNWNGEQLIPEQWVHDSVTPDAPHLMPGANSLSDNVMGYGYQWWIPEEPQGDYLAIGIYNQFIYVNPDKRLVIAKTSANHRYTEDDYISENQSVALFQAIADTFPVSTENHNKRANR